MHPVRIVPDLEVDIGSTHKAPPAYLADFASLLQSLGSLDTTIGDADVVVAIHGQNPISRKVRSPLTPSHYFANWKRVSIIHPCVM